MVVFDKPPGLPVQSQDSRSLQSLGNHYSGQSLHLIHRIDQPASGLVVFARHKEAASNLGAQFAAGAVARTYFAVVESRDKLIEDTLTHYLVKRPGKTNKMRVSEQMISGAQRAVLWYKILGHSDHYSLVQIDLKSGRQHQIRAQLAHIGLHIKGDVKYGSRRANKDRSIHLHATQLVLTHPVSGELICLTTLPPVDTLWLAFQPHIRATLQ